MRRTALVTGAGRGIGHAIAEALAEDAWVAAVDRAFPAASPASLTLEGDVTSLDDLRRAVGRVEEERQALDWLVCAAGITRDRVSWKMEEADWRAVLDVNLTGAFLAVRAALPLLRRSPMGRVVLLGSINGIRGRLGQTNYAASKAGLIGLARSLALELARDGVTVNVIAPGFIDTDMTRAMPEDLRQRAVARTPLGRMGRPEDIGRVTRFLCGEGGGFITGAVIPVDGGQLLGEVA